MSFSEAVSVCVFRLEICGGWLSAGTCHGARTHAVPGAHQTYAWQPPDRCTQPWTQVDSVSVCVYVATTVRESPLVWRLLPTTMPFVSVHTREPGPMHADSEQCHNEPSGAILAVSRCRRKPSTTPPDKKTRQLYTHKDTHTHTHIYVCVCVCVCVCIYIWAVG